MPRLTANQKAFTLIEVLMAATVLVVSFTAVIQAVMMGSDMIDTARKQLIAQQIIEEEISGQRLGTWTNLTSLTDGTNYLITVNADGTVTETPAPIPPATSKFALSSNASLLLQAKGFVCQVVPPVAPQVSYLKPASADATSVTFLAVTYKVTWSGTAGRPHNLTGLA